MIGITRLSCPTPEAVDSGLDCYCHKVPFLKIQVNALITAGANNHIKKIFSNENYDEVFHSFTVKDIGAIMESKNKLLLGQYGCLRKVLSKDRWCRFQYPYILNLHQANNRLYWMLILF